MLTHLLGPKKPALYAIVPGLHSAGNAMLHVCRVDRTVRRGARAGCDRERHCAIRHRALDVRHGADQHVRRARHPGPAAGEDVEGVRGLTKGRATPFDRLRTGFAPAWDGPFDRLRTGIGRIRAFWRGIGSIASSSRSVFVVGPLNHAVFVAWSPSLRGLPATAAPPLEPGPLGPSRGGLQEVTSRRRT